MREMMCRGWRLRGWRWDREDVGILGTRDGGEGGRGEWNRLDRKWLIG